MNKAPAAKEEQPAPEPQPFWRGVVVVLAPTLILGFLSYIHATLDNGRKEQLEFVRSQIVELYGPLFTLSSAFERVWDRLGRHRGSFDDPKNPPTRDQIVTWRTLLETVIAPISGEIEKTLLTSKQIVRCPDVRKELQDFIAFAESVKLLVVTWKSDGNASDMTEASNSPEKYPKKLPSLLDRQLTTLHARESRLDNALLGLLPGRDETECPAPAK